MRTRQALGSRKMRPSRKALRIARQESAERQAELTDTCDRLAWQLAHKN